MFGESKLCQNLNNCLFSSHLWYSNYTFKIISSFIFSKGIQRPKRKLVVGCNPFKLNALAEKHSFRIFLFQTRKRNKTRAYYKHFKGIKFCTTHLHVIVPKFNTHQDPKGRQEDIHIGTTYWRHWCGFFLDQRLLS